MLQNNQLTFKGNQIFNTIWANGELKTELYQAKNETAAKIYFSQILINVENNFYNFIKVK